MTDQITSHVWFTCTPVYKKRSPEDIAHSNELADSVRTEAIAIPSSFKIYQITFVRLLQSRSNYITPKFDKAVIFLSYLLEIRNCLKRYSLFVFSKPLEFSQQTLDGSTCTHPAPYRADGKTLRKWKPLNSFSYHAYLLSVTSRRLFHRWADS